MTLPQWIDAEAWDAFVEMRRAKGKRAPFTERAAKRILLELDRLRAQGYPPAEVLWQSTMNGWSGVFPVKHIQPHSSAPAPQLDSTQARLRQMEADKRQAREAYERARLAGVIRH